jgi:hypothetical protein
MTPNISPAGQVVRQYGYDLRALGAYTVRATTPDTVTAYFNNNFKGTQARWAIRDAINGARIIVENNSATMDIQIPSADGVRTLMTSHPGVNAVGTGQGSSVKIYTETEKTAERLRNLLRTELPNKTPVAVDAIGIITAQAL